MQRTAILLALLLAVAAVAPAVGVAGAASTSDGPAQGPSISYDHDSQAATCEFPYSETDATGTEVTIDADPERVVTVNPSAAQTMWEIGAQDEVVGVSQYAAYLDGADAKANVSGATGPDVETVLEVEPDLVLVPNSTYALAPERTAQIREQGIPVFVFERPTSLEFVADKTERIGRLTGNCEAGSARADEMRRSLDAMEQALAETDRPVGLHVSFGFTAGSNTFTGDVITAAGIANGAAEAGISGFAMLNDEAVVEINPEWIVITNGTSVPDTAAYESTTAVQEGNIVRVDSNRFSQPAPRAIHAAEDIMAQVHPDAYEEYQSIKAESAASDTSPTAQPTSAATAAEPSEPASTESPATSSTDSPGFGITAMLGALAVVALLAARP